MKKVNVILSAILLMAILPLVSATECYQETANVSTVCGGLDTGNYNFLNQYGANQWSNPSALYDGDWETATFVYDGWAVMDINYTKPTNSVGMIWAVKTPDGYTNFTIPQDCWDAQANQVSLSVVGYVEEYVRWYCYNGTGQDRRFGDASYNLLGQTTHDYSTDVYEEAVYWQLPAPIEITYPVDSTIYYSQITYANITLRESMDACWITTGKNSCYQETPNVTSGCGDRSQYGFIDFDATSNDGSWTNSGNIVDGNWETAGYGDSAWLYLGYQKPVSFTNATFRIKIGTDGVQDYLIPDDCVNFAGASGDIFMWVYHYFDDGNYKIICQNDSMNPNDITTEWTKLHLLYQGNTAGYDNFYEEAMVWGIPDYTPFACYVNDICYQEYANATTCGQTTVGSYTGMPEGTIDGNYNSGSGATGSSVNGATINYTIPNGVTSAIWQIMDVDGIPYWSPFNLTIPSTCIDDETTLQLKIEDMSSYFNYYCYDGSWSLVGTSQYTEQDPSWFNEEAMIWFISNSVNLNASVGNNTWTVYGNKTTGGLSECYQEQTNVSSLTDGSCSLNYSGSYSGLDAHNLHPFCVDGNWSVGSYCYPVPTGKLIMNYTKPTNAVSGVWTLLYNNAGNIWTYLNLTIPDSCFNQEVVSFAFWVETPSYNVTFSCYNSTDWVTLYSEFTDGNPASEEGVYWTIDDSSTSIYSDSVFFQYELPDTTSPTSTYIRNLLNRNLSVDVNVSDETGVDNASFFIYDIFDSLVYSTTQLFYGATSGVTQFSYLFLYDGVFKWFYVVVDTSGNIFLSSNNTEVFSSISIDYPTATTYNSTVDNLNYIPSTLNNCWYSTDLGVTNNSITCGNNVTGLNANNTGSYTWIVYGQYNSTSETVSDSVTFSVDIPEPVPSPTPNKTYPPQSPEVVFMQEAVANPSNSLLAYDGNTSSYTGVYPANNGNWYIGYNWTSTVGTKVNMTAVVHTYDGSSGTITFSCLNLSDSNYLDLATFTATGTEEYGDVTYDIPQECIGTWITIPDHLEFRAVSTADFSVGEFLIYNNEVPSPSPSPSPSVSQQDVVAGTLTSAGTGMAVLISAVTNPLVFIIMSLATIGLIVGIVYFMSIWVKGMMKFK